MENGSFMKAASVAMGVQEGQAELAASSPATEVNQASAEIAAEQPTDTNPTPAPTDIAPVTTEAPIEQTQPSTSEPYNYWPDLDTQTEGLVKDGESLTAMLTKAKEYDALAAERSQLFKPANDYIAKLNEMTLAGANPDQIKAFVRVNGFGDLDALSAVEVKVQKLVLKDGFSEDIARKIIDREFNLKQFDEEIPEQKEEADILREKLRVSAESDRNVLKEYKKDISTVANPEKEIAERMKLETLANTTNYNKTVAQEAPNIAKHFPDKLSYEFKVGDEAIPYEDNFEKEFLEKDLSRYVQEYFTDSMDPVNADTISQAYSFALGEYLKQNDAKRLEKAYQKGHTTGFEKAVNKYENRSGLPKAQENQIVATTESGQTEFMRKMVGKQ